MLVLLGIAGEIMRARRRPGGGREAGTVWALPLTLSGLALDRLVPAGKATEAERGGQLGWVP